MALELLLARVHQLLVEKMYRQAKAGWFHDFEVELEAQRKASLAKGGRGFQPRRAVRKVIPANGEDAADDQPGPSGITNVRVVCIRDDGVTILQSYPSDSSDDEDIDRRCSIDRATSMTAPQPEVDDDSANEDEDKPDENPYAVFAEKVTIAGLPEAYRSRFKSDLILFRLALLFAFAMIAYESVKISAQYQDDGVIFTDLELIGTRAPFPNISVCFPPVINGPRVLDFMKIPPKLIALAMAANITIDQVLEFIRKTVSLQINMTDRSKKLYTITKRFFDEALIFGSDQGQDVYWEGLQMSCPEVLSSCYFGRQQFDCCDGARFSYLWSIGCYQVGVSLLCIDPLSSCRYNRIWC